MNVISNETRIAQETYAARPFAVRWEDSHSALTNRFETFDEAFAYAQKQVLRICADVKRASYSCASNFYRSNIQTPEGRMPLRYYFFADDVSSYR
jgi:hypothetical protein